jgi:hypothetical protein
VLGLSIVPLSTILSLNFGTVPTVWYFYNLKKSLNSFSCLGFWGDIWYSFNRPVTYRQGLWEGVYFQLFLAYLEKLLCKIHLNFWIMVVDDHSHLHCNQEGHNFITIGFIGSPIRHFERSLSLPPGPQGSLVPPCIISLGAPAYRVSLR